METADWILAGIILWAVPGFILGMAYDIDNGYRVMAIMIIWPFIVVWLLLVWIVRSIMGVLREIGAVVRELTDQ